MVYTGNGVKKNSMAGTKKTHQAYKTFDHHKSNPGRLARFISVICFSFIFLILVTSQAQAQYGSSSYELIPAPDLWYNDVDGVRIGVRLKGQVPGTFEDGPHRLDAGLWLGLWFPDQPVSYYMRYTEPIPAWSDFGSEASVQAVSSIRAGYSMHGLGFNKRWQQGFDERSFREIRLFNSFAQRFDSEYTAFPVRWANSFGADSKYILSSLTGMIQDENSLGRYNLELNGTLQLNNEAFGVGWLTATQRVPFNSSWGLHVRGFAGLATESASSEFLFSRSTGQAITTLQSGVTRAKGTIPHSWVTSGNFQVAGGANIRGYTSGDVKSFTSNNCTDCEVPDLKAEPAALYQSMFAINSELDYPNLIRTLFKGIPYASDFLDFRSYLFFDAGSPLGINNSPKTLFADAGTGFSISLNIPGYLGKNRGFVFRYDIPFWLSESGNEDAFKFRSLFAFGAVISF